VPDDRRTGRARRDSDQAIELLVDRLRDAEQRFERELEKLEGALDRLGATVDERVRELEAFHIEERARAGEQIARRLRRAQFIASAASLAAVAGVVLAVLEHFAHI
jgi:hypothetical protein